jgi:hypothetical protein
MTKLMLILGIVLMVLAFGWLFFFVGTSAPSDNPTLANLENSLFCRKGETFVQELGAYHYDPVNNNSGQEVTFYCQDVEGQRRDVTGNAVVIGIAGFAVPFVVGLLMTIGLSTLMVARRMRRMTQTVFGNVPTQVYTLGGSSPHVTVRVNGQEVTPSSTMSPEVAQGVQTAFDAIQSAFSGSGSSNFTTVQINGQPTEMTPEMAQKVQKALSAMEGAFPGHWVGSGGNLTDKLRQLEDARSGNLITQEEYDHLRQQILDSMK